MPGQEGVNALLCLNFALKRERTGCAWKWGRTNLGTSPFWSLFSHSGSWWAHKIKWRRIEVGSRSGQNQERGLKTTHDPKVPPQPLWEFSIRTLYIAHGVAWDLENPHPGRDPGISMPAWMYITWQTFCFMGPTPKESRLWPLEQQKNDQASSLEPQVVTPFLSTIYSFPSLSFPYVIFLYFYRRETKCLHTFHCNWIVLK